MYKLVYDNIEKNVDTEEKRDKLIEKGYTLLVKKEENLKQEPILEVNKQAIQEEPIKETIQEEPIKEIIEETKEAKKANSKK